MALPFRATFPLPEAELQALQSALGRPQILADVVAWAARQRGRISDVVVQDEFTHDVVVALPGPPPLWLVFDTT
jgi:hypothetical protein